MPIEEMCLEEAGFLNHVQVECSTKFNDCGKSTFFDALSGSRNSGGSCRNDPSIPLPNARTISIEFHPDVSNEDVGVSHSKHDTHKCHKASVDPAKFLFLGHPNGDAVWSIP